MQQRLSDTGNKKPQKDYHVSVSAGTVASGMMSSEENHAQLGRHVTSVADQMTSQLSAAAKSIISSHNQQHRGL